MVDASPWLHRSRRSKPRSGRLLHVASFALDKKYPREPSSAGPARRKSRDATSREKTASKRGGTAAEREGGEEGAGIPSHPDPKHPSVPT